MHSKYLKRNVGYLTLSARKDEEYNDPYVVGDEKLREFSDKLRNNSRSGISKHIPYHSNASATTLNENMPSPERPGTRPLPATAFLLKQISDANMLEVRNDSDRLSFFIARKCL